MSNTKNKMIDLNDHMFEQLERLNDNELTGGKLQEEIERSRAMASVASQIIAGASLALKARIAIDDRLLKNVPEMLELKDQNDG
ncbi:MAG: hypothetical protein V3T30_05960 [Thermodesulfobacteriota bacterium]